MSDTKIITVQRWYHNPEIWLNVFTGVVNVTSLAAASVGALGLGPAALFYVSIGLAVLTNVATVFVKMLSKSVVASKASIEAIQDMPSSPEVETSVSNAKGTAAKVELKTHRGGR